MSHDEPNSADERSAARLLRLVDLDAPPPDPAQLAALRAASAAAFASSAAASAHSAPPGGRMLTLGFRVALALSAAIIALVSWFSISPPTTIAGSPRFNEVLARLAEHESLQLRLARDGGEVDVWVRAPGLVRWDDAPRRYRIAAGSRLWRIDEDANQATESPSPLFRSPRQQLDLLALLDLSVDDPAPLLSARASRRERLDDRDCLVYAQRLRTASPEGPRAVDVEVFVDEPTRDLVALRAWPVRSFEGLRRTPLAELRLVATNIAIADEKFAVSKTLTDDGRIGQLVTAQGLVTLRPALARRWTPLVGSTPFKAGDWLRADLRGANAALVRLASGVELTVGPGALVELTSPTRATLHSGQVQVRVPAPANPAERPAPFELLGPGQERKTFAEPTTTLLRVDRDERLVEVPMTPVWLAGFEGTTSNESLGSLLVNLPDGRNEPLTVGQHHVRVEIRDQIARTTIEETFVNHTPSRLEGVFQFPLPADASISGFGMWIGNELVEADIVEKQRAREIYETILREKRDPGLLEWTSGNLFKARVFPIEPHSEKKIKIVYTQVLPLRGNEYRYVYGLRSEMLRTKPLRSLSFDIQLSSALPIKAIRCPTHSTRIQQTDHAGRVEFAAQEISPDRDLEVVVELGARQSDVVVTPHRRGEDGYFLLQLMPPSDEGAWRADAVSDGAPLQLVLLCDTSASMDSRSREQQAEFVRTILSSLGPDDRFLLGAADVGVGWATRELVAATPDQIAQAQKFLAERVSLGWTDLDRAFSDTIARSPASATVIYIGDGLVTTGNADPAAFAQRCVRLLSGSPQAGDAASAAEPRRTFHAVSVGNAYERTVLQAIAAHGHGSTREISGERTPAHVARELLLELTRPGLRDLQVEFRGVRVAAVYPERLPNLPAGTQQLLVGRYLPEGRDQRGEVVVTGWRGNQRIRYAATIQFADAEQGNSFIPRLWARSHLDHLLAQGSAPEVRDDIIRLSEEFHIITPYTSLLVLETDADRERFGVQRRFEMRDGERFFAEGRAKANFELLQAQMKRARLWRAELRREVLRDLAQLGRHPERWDILSQHTHSGPSPVATSNTSWFDRRAGGRTFWAGGMGGGFGGGLSGGFAPAHGGFAPASRELLEDLADADSPVPFFASPSRGDLATDFSDNLSLIVDQRQQLELEDAHPGASDDLGEVRLEKAMPFDGMKRSRDKANHWQFQRGLAKSQSESSVLSAFTGLQVFVADGKGEFEELEDGSGFDPGYLSPGLGSGRYYRHVPGTDLYAWYRDLFPEIPLRAARSSPVVPKPATWSDEAYALANRLLRIEALRAMEGGVVLDRTESYFEPDWNRQSSQSKQRVLASRSGWLTKALDPGNATPINYCDERERAAYTLHFRLGTRRTGTSDAERAQFPLALNDGSLLFLAAAYANYSARVEAAEEGVVRLILSNERKIDTEIYVIDTRRQVVVRREVRDANGPISTIVFDDFAPLAGGWMARQVTVTDPQKRVIQRVTYALETLAAEPYAQRWAQELADRPSIQFLDVPLPRLADARQRRAAGSATVSDRIALLRSALSNQQWNNVWQELDALEKAAPDSGPGGKSGVRWLRTLLDATGRRDTEARARFLVEARALAARPTPSDWPLAQYLLSKGREFIGWNEYAELLNLLKPVFDRQPEAVHALEAWDSNWIAVHDALRRPEVALELQRQQATASPWRVENQLAFARRLVQLRRVDEAIAWLKRELERPERRDKYQIHQLCADIAERYREARRWDELVTFTATWIERDLTPVYYPSAFLYHLFALLRAGRDAELDALCRQWLNLARVDRELTPIESQKFEAVIQLLHGHSALWSSRPADHHFGPLLVELASVLSRRADKLHYAQQIANDSRFGEQDETDRLRGEWFDLLRNSLPSFTANQLDAFVRWTLGGRIWLAKPIDGRTQMQASEIPNEYWQPIAAAIRERWSRSEDLVEKSTLARTLIAIYSQRFPGELLPFRRQCYEIAPAKLRSQYQSELFTQLLSDPWTEANESELFTIWRGMGADHRPGERTRIQGQLLESLIDRLVDARIAAARTRLSDQGGLDKLTRAELAAKQSAFLREARQGLVERLQQERTRVEGPITVWLELEQAYLDARLGERRVETEALAWRLLGDKPTASAALPPPENLDDHEVAEKYSDDLLLEHLRREAQLRAWSMVSYFATQRSAPEAFVDRTLRYAQAGVELPRAAGAAWRLAHAQLLVALDRPDELERSLREALRTDVSTAPWGTYLAHVLAERGEFDEAIAIFEARRRDRLLSAADFRQLALWHVARNQPAAAEAARLDAYRLVDESRLENLLWPVLNRIRSRQGQTTELDDATLLTFRALLEKSPNPDEHLRHLGEIYRATHDFRLLAVVPEAVLGRTPEKIYPALERVHSVILGEVRREAVVDELLAHLDTLRKGERTDADQRALDLLEMLVARRAAELTNQPGPHVQRCLAALRRANARPWAEGEPSQMARFLYQLGALPQAELAAEQLRQLTEFVERSPAASRERLELTVLLGSLEFYAYGRRDAGVRRVGAEIEAYRQAQQGRWPPADNDSLYAYIAMLSGQGQFVTAERELVVGRTKAEHSAQRDWYDQQLAQLFVRAFDRNGAISLGSGRDDLLPRLLAYFEDAIKNSNDSALIAHRLGKWIEVLRLAHQHKMASAAPETTRLAHEVIPALLARSPASAHSILLPPVDLIRAVHGPAGVLRYTLERLEQLAREDQRIGGALPEDQFDNVQNQLISYFTQSRKEAKLAEYDERILKLTLAVIRSDLRQGKNGAFHPIYTRGYEQFWSERVDDFARVAEEVLAERKDSGRRAFTVANFLWNRLLLQPRAIEILLVAQRAGALEESSQWQLARWLHESSRFAESIALLESLVERRQGNLEYRVALMVAYHKSMRPEQRVELLRRTDEYFHAAGRWSEGAAAALGHGCQACDDPRAAINYFVEAIALHQRANPVAGRNNATLSDYYQCLAQAHSQRQDTTAAVEAASAAIVCWGPQQRERTSAIESLRRVFERAEKLDEYVRQLDEQVAKSGQDSPLVRKNLGLVYLAKGELPRAIAQLRLAIELQPNDGETHQALLEAYDKSGDSAAATRQLLARIDVERSNLALYTQLAERLKEVEGEAERAATSIVEAGPNEAENHAAFAELRERQQRTPEAIEHWRRAFELRKLEPTYLLKLADAQIRERRWDDARRTVRQLESSDWPELFQGRLPHELNRLREMFPKE